MQIAIIRTALGELPLAQQTAQRAQETILRLGPAHELRFGVAALGSILAYLLDGSWLDSTTSAAGFAASPDAARNPRSLVAGAYAALGYVRMGNEAEAARLLVALTPVLERMEPTMYVYHAAVAFGGSAVWEMGAVEFAGAYRRMALDLVSGGFGESMLSHELTVARMAALLGDASEAGDYFAQARQKAEARGFRPILAIGQYDEALALIREGSTNHPRILSLIDTATEAFRSMGMNGWAARALSLRERLSESPRLRRGRAESHPGGLTPREVEVLRLLAAGRTNTDLVLPSMDTPTVPGGAVVREGKRGVSPRQARSRPLL